MLILAPRIDVNSERWFEPLKGLKLKVKSIDNDQFRSRNALVRRHIEKLDAVYKVGTTDFDPAKVGDTDAIDDLLIDTCARFLLSGWEGVGEMIDGEEKAIDYTPEGGISLLRQKPELYWIILSEASNIAQGKEEQKKATVGKSSRRRAG